MSHSVGEHDTKKIMRRKMCYGTFAKRLVLINRAAISKNVTSTMLIVAMIAVWFIAGSALGI
jgi:hypothetical protein